MKNLLVLCAFIIASFGACITQRYVAGQFTDVTTYKLRETYKTPKGVSVDDPQHLLYPKVVDKFIDEVEACLAAHAPTWSTAEIAAGSCNQEKVPRNLVRSYLAVKVPPDWYVSACSGEQEFKCGIDQKLCNEKPATIGMPCPCACRATLQGGWVLTAPNMKLFKHELVRLVTGCNNPSGAVNECVRTPAYPLVDLP